MEQRRCGTEEESTKELSISETPTVSRIECIEREGTPRSTVRSPVLAAMIGPMVVPHGQSLRTMNSCTWWLHAVVTRGGCTRWLHAP